MLASGKERGFVRGAKALLGRGNAGLAFKLIDLGELRNPSSRSLSRLRRQALDRLRERYQQLHPFNFVLSSERSGAEVVAIPE